MVEDLRLAEQYRSPLVLCFLLIQPGNKMADT